MQEFQIGPQEAGQRFDKYLKKLLPEASSGFLYKMLRKKNFTLNGAKAAGDEVLQVKDEVKLFLSEETFQKFAGAAVTSREYQKLRSLNTVTGAGAPLAGTLNPASQGMPDIIYEDADILIINKPAGMLSQKAAPEDVSANEYILNYLIQKGELTEAQLRTFRPSVCNRLDRNTSGLLIAGKSLKGLQEMSAALKERSVQKYYRCLVLGEMRKAAQISGWLVKDPDTNRVTVLKQAPVPTRQSESQKPQRIETGYRPIAVGNGYTELEVHLITGRSHQIRAHLASIGHPVLGDPKYGDPAENRRLKKALPDVSQLLHAYRLEFADGRSFTAPVPEEYEAARAACLTASAGI